MFAVLYSVNRYICVLTTRSTSYCLCDTLMDPCNVCVCVYMYVCMYVCTRLCAYFHQTLANWVYFLPNVEYVIVISSILKTVKNVG